MSFLLWIKCKIKYVYLVVGEQPAIISVRADRLDLLVGRQRRGRDVVMLTQRRTGL